MLVGVTALLICEGAVDLPRRVLRLCLTYRKSSLRGVLRRLSGSLNCVSSRLPMNSLPSGVLRYIEVASSSSSYSESQLVGMKLVALYSELSMRFLCVAH